MIEREASSSGVSIARASLRQWVAAHESRINDLRREEPDATRLADAQRSLDDLLGYGRAGAVAEEIPDIEDYAAWLALDERLPGAEVVLDRLRNLSGQNLSGHVRQSYYAVVRFLFERPQHVEPLASELDSMAQRDDIYQPDDDLSRDWIRHLDEHATELGDGWDYAVLRGILPPNLGGTRSGGGGGSSTLKRMLPLVARFLRRRASG